MRITPSAAVRIHALVSSFTASPTARPIPGRLRSANPATEGHSIQSDVGVELKGVRWS